MSTLVRAKAALVLVALFSTMLAAGPTSLASPLSGAQQSVGIVALRHAADGAQTRIILEGTAELPYTIYRPDERTILVDLPGVDASKLDDGYPVDSRGVERIQVERLRTASGQSLARLRIRLRSQVEDRTVIEGRNLILTLSAATSAPAASAPAPTPAPTPAAASTPVGEAPASMRAEMPVAKPVATSALAPARPAAGVPENPATAITAVRTDVSNGTFRAFIAADGRVSFKHFLLPNPDRIVIDITGVKSSVERNAMEVNLGGISRIRVGQFRTADPKVVRIVFDVTKMGPYDVRQVGSDLVLSLGAGASAPIPAAAKTSAPPQRTVPEAAPTKAPPVSQPLAPAPKPAVSKPIVSDDDPADSPVTVKPSTKPAVKSSAPPKDAIRQPAATPVRPVSDELQPQNATGRPVTRPAGAAAQPRSAQSAPPGPMVPRSTGNDYMQEGFIGRPVNLELKNVDLRDVLRFLHNRFGVNFIVDKSVPPSVPVDVSLKDVPWNQALEAILKSQGLGLVREDGKMIRVSTLASIAAEGDAQRKVQESYINSLPLVTKIFKLKYASPVNKNTQASPGGGGQSQADSPTFDPSSIRTGIYAFIKNRLSTRGRLEFDGRTNSVIVTDLAARIEVIDEIIRALDRPQPQVEIEARIVIARRNFLRDLGVQLSAGAANPSRGGFAGISSIPLLTSSASASTTDEIPQNVGIPSLGGLIPAFPGGLLGAPQVLDGQTLVNLTTGIIGTFQISAVIYASEQKGQIRTVAAPRITTQNNTTAEVVNGVQIPVQTISNNTITTTYVDAALRLNITPQIIVEDGAVLLSVIAENNDVSTLRTVGGTPGINTQSATAVVLVPDGGTTVLGGINIDQENQSEARTPGLSRIPLFGNLFKRRNTNRDTQEILFFITPRIFRPELVGLTQESSLRSNDITITPVISGGEGNTSITIVDRSSGAGGSGATIP